MEISSSIYSVARLGFALYPLADRLMELLKQRQVLHADETPVKQLDPGAGKTKRAYLWSYRSNDLDTGPPIVVFDYQTSRSGQHARDLLQGWQGSLMVDDYAGYKKLFAHDAIHVVTELGCWAHARRKFFDLQVTGAHPMAEEALRRIGQLYAIEKEASAMDSASRKQLRQENSLPILADMYDWLIRLRTSTANNSGLARSIDYTLNRWASLIRYEQTGNLPIDNNRSRMRFVRLPSARRTGCSQGVNVPVNGLRQFKVSLPRQNSMASNRLHG